MKTLFICGLLCLSGYSGQAQEVHTITVSINQPETCELVLGVNLHTSESPFRVFPIPANQKFTIESESTLDEILLLDLKGSELLRLYPRSSRQEIPVSNLPAGVYILRLRSDSKFHQYQIIVEQ